MIQMLSQMLLIFLQKKLKGELDKLKKHKIVLTGEPCGCKTKSIDFLLKSSVQLYD
jgi:hypothetical protein